MPHIREVPRAGARRWEVIWRAEGRANYRLFASDQAAQDFAASLPPATRGYRGSGPRPVAERIRNMSRTDENGCWIWQGRPTNAGYGLMTLRTDGVARSTSAHRVAYETFVGPVPDGLVLDHLCRVRMCVNPAHLEPVTSRENTMRSPITLGFINAAKTHCPHGHPYDEANTYVWVRPNTTMRICRTCARRHHANYIARKKAAA